MTAGKVESNNSIVVSQVSRVCQGRAVLKGINLQISAGEIFGIYGRSGSGKTRLLRVLAGLDLPDSGRVSIEAADDDQSSWLQAIPAIAFQSPSLAPELTVFENMLLFARLWDISRRGRTNRIARYLELLDLVELRNKKVRTLAYGAKVRMELARALLSESPILLIDSIVETLDSDVRLRVWNHLQNKAKTGTSVIVATASAREAELCDRIAVLERGNLEFVGKPEELVSRMEPDIVVIQAVRPPLVREKIQEKLAVTVEEREGTLVFSTNRGKEAVQDILAELGSDISTIYLKQPKLSDVLEKLR